MKYKLKMKLTMGQYNFDGHMIQNKKGEFTYNHYPAGSIFTIIKEKLPKTFLRDKKGRIINLDSSNSPEKSSYLKQNFELIVIDYNRFWAKFNEK